MEEKSSRGGPGGGARRRAAARERPARERAPRDRAPRDRSKIQCRYGMECRNTKCPFFHHPAATNGPSAPHTCTPVAAHGTPPPPPSPLFADAGRHGPGPARANGHAGAPAAAPSRRATTRKKCRWGAGCRNKKCTFLHPGQPFDRGAAQGPRARATAVAEAGMDLAPESRVSHNAVPVQVAKDKDATRPVHPILPPSPDTRDMPKIVRKASRPPGFLTPASTSNSDARLQFQASISRFNDIFPISSAPTSGFFGHEASERERTPLYSKTSAFRTPHPLTMAMAERPRSASVGTAQVLLEKHAHFCPTARDAAADDPSAAHAQDQPPDADWLFEVLGLNGIDVNASEAGEERPPVMDEVAEKRGHVTGNNAVKQTPSAQQFCLPSKSDTSQVGVNASTHHKRPIHSLVPEEEMVQSRRVARELRLEAQQTTNSPEVLFTLLQQCRSKQDMIKNALEGSMDSYGDNESTVVNVLALNEFLVGAIEAAESALHMSKPNGDARQDVGPKTVPSAKLRPEARIEERKKEMGSLVKPGHTKTAPTVAKTATKKKPAGTPVKVKTSANKAAKKSSPIKSTKMHEVKHQKQEAKLAANMSSQSTPSVDTSVPSPTHDPAHDAEEAARQEKERMTRLLEEARSQAAAARERKKSKKSRKFDRWLKQNEEARALRARSWSALIAEENDYVELIRKLLVREFLRQSQHRAMGLTAERVLSNAHAAEVIAEECRKAYRIIFGGIKRRVVVAGSDNKDLNGRQGTIRYWDKEKEKFCVGMDTKKSPDSDVQLLIPDILDVVASRPTKADKQFTATSCDIRAPTLLSYGGVSLGYSFTLQKSHVIALGSAESTKIGLEVFCTTRDQEERRQKMEEEAERRQDEQDRQRRAARKARDNAAWERRKEQMRRDKQDYEDMKKEWARERRRNGASMFDYDDDNSEECECPRCRFGERFSSSGGAFFFNIGGIPFRVRFDSYDSDEESFFDEFDEKWEEQLAEEKNEENRKQARILGIESDADSRTIKLAYRKMALQFHPDKWKSDSGHGMSRKAAEDRFKAVQAAYDHMMSNFDE